MPKNFMKGDGKNTKIVEIPDDILLPGNLNAIDQGRKVINVKGNNAQPGVANYAVSLNAVINKSIEEGRIDVTGPDLGAVVTVDGTQTITGDKTISGDVVISGEATLSGATEISGETTLSGSTEISGATELSNISISAANLPEYADNAAAVSGGLAVGRLYQSSGTIKIVTA